MQLKVRRSQRDGGVISKSAIFCLDARAEYTAEERRHIARYKLGKEVIYDSQARTAMTERSGSARDARGRPVNYHGDVGDMLGGAARNAASGVFSAAKSLGMAAVASAMLRVTVESLERGHHIECKSLEELLAAEDAILTACQNLRVYLETAATFDGREVLFNFVGDQIAPLVVAATPAPALIAAPAEPSAAVPQPDPPAQKWQAVEVKGQGTGAEGATASDDERAPAAYVPSFGDSGMDETTKKFVVGGAIVLALLFLNFAPKPLPLIAIVLVALSFGGYKLYQSRA